MGSLKFLALCVVFGFVAAAEQPKLSLAEKEEFLLNAKIIKQTNLSKGVTNSRQATLDDGKLRHDAHIQTVDISKASYQTQRGT